MPCNGLHKGGHHPRLDLGHPNHVIAAVASGDGLGAALVAAVCARVNVEAKREKASRTGAIRMDLLLKFTVWSRYRDTRGTEGTSA
jgi:hypothetical protein